MWSSMGTCYLSTTWAEALHQELSGCAVRTPIHFTLPSFRAFTAFLTPAPATCTRVLPLVILLRPVWQVVE